MLFKPSLGIAAWRSTGTTLWMPLYLEILTKAYTDLGRFSDAWCSIGEAISTIEKGTKDGARLRSLARQWNSR
jgi:hypothetical protein